MNVHILPSFIDSFCVVFGSLWCITRREFLTILNIFIFLFSAHCICFMRADRPKKRNKRNKLKKLLCIHVKFDNLKRYYVSRSELMGESMERQNKTHFMYFIDSVPYSCSNSSPCEWDSNELQAILNIVHFNHLDLYFFYLKSSLSLIIDFVVCVIIVIDLLEMDIFWALNWLLLLILRISE